MKLTKEQKQYIINKYIDEFEVKIDKQKTIEITNIIFNKNELENIGYMFRNDCFDLIVNVKDRDIILSNYKTKEETINYIDTLKNFYNITETEITKYPVFRRAQAGIGYLAQEASVFRKMSVEDNIMAVLEMTGKPKAYQEQKLESLLSEFRLNHVRKNLGDRLSGGERRRTEIARCLAIEPKFIMLDEPFAAVDPIAVEDIQYIVWQLKYRNIGILVTDHKAEAVLGLVDRAYLLFEGKILFQGKPKELAENEIVRKRYLGVNFELPKQAFQINEGGTEGSEMAAE